MKNKLKKLKYKVVKWLIHRSSTAMQIVIECRNEVADYYEHCLDVANDEMDKLEQKRLDVLDKIRAEIEQAADKQFQIAMGVSDLNERYAHIQMENAYRHSLNVIDKYKAERV